MMPRRGRSSRRSFTLMKRTAWWRSVTTRVSRCGALATSGGGISRPKRGHQHPPRRRQIVRRHIIIEQALARRCAVDALGDSERDLAVEHRAAAIPRKTVRAVDRNPGRRAGAAAQVSRRRIVGELYGRAAVARAFAIVADKVASARARDIAPADEPAERPGAAVRIEKGVGRVGAAV